MSKIKYNISDYSNNVYLNALLENIDDVVYIKDLESNYVLCSKTMLETYKINSLEEIIGKSDCEIFPESIATPYLESDQKIYNTQKPVIDLPEDIDLQSEPDKAKLVVSKYPLFNGNHDLIGILGINKKIHKNTDSNQSLNVAMKKLTELNQALEDISSKDELTGLFNRRHFNNQLTLLVHRHNLEMYTNKDISLIMIDIDKFKSINDSYGHNVGDMVLIHCAKIIKCSCKKCQIVARYSGDEFMVLVEKNKKEATKIAEKMKENINNDLFEKRDIQVRLSFSIGIANIGELKLKTSDNLLDLVDKRLYISKRTGRNKVTSEGGFSDRNLNASDSY